MRAATNEKNAVGASVPASSDAATKLVLAIFRTNGRLLRSGDVLTKDLGLTAARWQVLGAIEHKAKTVAQISRDYELTRQGVLWVVQAMIKDGTVELIHNPDHRRAKLVQPTENGRQLYQEVARRQRDWASQLAEAFTAPELADALDVVVRLGDAVLAPDRDDR